MASSPPAASRASIAHAVCEAVDSPRPAQAGSVVGPQILAPAAVRILVLDEPAHGPPDAGLVRQYAGGDEGRHDGTGAVHVVRAPATEPGAVWLLGAQQPGHPAPRRPGSRRGPRRPAPRPYAPSRRPTAGRPPRRSRRRAAWSPAGRCCRRQRRAQPPSRDCIPVSQVSARATAAPASLAVASSGCSTRPSASTTSAVSSTSG